MTACPCAQTLVQARSRERLLADGFGEDEIERIFDAVPVATHNQRGLGTLHVGCPEGCDIDIDGERLLAIVEDSMSSEIYELMKRSDEGAVVEKAHRRPRFVEDCVREMIRGVVDGMPELRDELLRLRPPGEPRDDPSAQRRRRALRPAWRAAPRARARASTRSATSRCASGSTARLAASVRLGRARHPRSRPRRARAPRSPARPAPGPSTAKPASAATAGPSDMSTPNTPAGSRRSASSSSE